MKAGETIPQKLARYITEMNWKSVDVKGLAGCLQLEDGTSNQAPNVRVAISLMNCVEAPPISWNSLHTINPNVDCTGCVLEIKNCDIRNARPKQSSPSL